MDDALFELHIRERDIQVQAAALERVGYLAGVVRGQKHHGGFGFGFDSTDFRDGHLIVRQHFQQQGFKLVVGLVYFVDQQHTAVRFFQRFQQRPRLKKFLAEEDVAKFVQPAN